MMVFLASVFLVFYAALPYIAWGSIALYVIVAILGRKHIIRELLG